MTHVKRKAIQLLLDPKGRIVALADDGTIWVKSEEWIEVLPLPDDSDFEAADEAENDYRQAHGR